MLMADVETQPGQLSKTIRSLSRALSRRCRGRTTLVGRGWPELEVGLLHRGVDVVSSSSFDTFETVILARALEYGAEAPSRLLHDAWRLLMPEGRLLVCVPNEECVEDPEATRRFTRRSLKRLLTEIDQPRILKDQPYRWLVMSLDAKPRLDPTARRRLEVIAALCKGSVIELGCARGHLSKIIADRGLPIRGVDKNTSKVSTARELFPDIEFSQSDILDLPTKETYDSVILAEVLEHVSPETGDLLLMKAWNLVSLGGRLIVSVPNEDCVPHKNHLREFDRRDLNRLLEPLGRPRLVTKQPFKWLLMYVERCP
jgi:2-polyprenyl-3-methyl-5-hydroxy-6-metoxy-1,4-benzoquinol methylase